MNRPYSRELSADTAVILIPLITTLFATLALVMAILRVDFEANWHFWLVFVILPLCAYTAWRMIGQDRIEQANHLFIITAISLLTLIMAIEWPAAAGLPYLFAILIIMASMTLHPEVGFLMWGLSSLGTIVAATIANEAPGFRYLYTLVAPLSVNFLLAATAYLSAYEWRFAVESVSQLHRKVRQRRDELFSLQEELRLNNAILHSINQEVERARQEAVTEKELRSRFMNNVSHELRMPLNSIVNFAHILAQGARGQVNTEQVDYLNRIEQSGWHLLSVLNDLLDMAQIEAGEFQLHMELVDLQTICEEALSSVQGLLLEKDIQLERVYPAVWPDIYADSMRLKQALINVLGNATKYTEEGCIQLKVIPQVDTVVVAVSDTGLGIAPEDQALIFEEFRQVNNSVARRRVGTGLGLPITRHLVERHGGQIWVESALGQGSTFYISLPIRPETDSAQADSGGDETEG